MLRKKEFGKKDNYYNKDSLSLPFLFYYYLKSVRQNSSLFKEMSYKIGKMSYKNNTKKCHKYIKIF